MTSVFARLSSRSSFQAPHRSALSLPNHTALFMPSTALGIGTAIKAVSVPSSPTDIRGLPASTLVIDDDTGAVKAIVNARSLTATRNAAGSVLASRLLLSKTPTTLVAFGAGKQIEAHVDLHLRAFPSLNTITLVNRSVNDRVLALLNILHARHPLITFNVLASTPTPADNPDSNVSTNSGDHLDLESLVRAAHIICTATPSTSPLFPSSWVSPGTHLNLVGSFKPTMREIDDALVKRAGVVVVDSREACLVEAGELIGAGLGEESMVEIGEIVAINVGDGEAEKLKKCVDVRSKGDVTIFKSVGVGLQDVAIACLVVKRAEEMGVGVHVEAYDA
ncbi:hypothetical protein SERLA73DRAFT_110946 [Serpula lacrymans var. lacrymans S7.3]|uniref:NAD(P)-binding protein n=2 Tax=Serpula lacrymans var. lacrymans TaxID=341189 RepID=F8Q375_SERL3|nr:hypothetical protein SERLA73DRAFT_110946 [Serpula lacrymans var. lacrymans S7.3]